MLKKLLCMAAFMMATMGVFAQPKLTNLPLNPAVRHGVLPNGLSYYILHNEEPKNRANFYIAQKVGSTLETPEQLGLAHFLEHMAFNGTKNFPGKNMLNYLQNNGIRFGSDINAYTGFDETVYRINNVPSTDKQLMDSVLLCLYDWSCGILLEESEINAERGVIEEEWRSRNDANFRMMEQTLPQMFAEYQYQQLPIGKMSVVKNFEPQVLRDYYKKWYRPDQQGIIIVGDFNAAEMEKKVKKLFSKVPKPVDPAPRLYPNVSDNDKPIYVYFEDKELQVPIVRISFKKEKLPFEQRNTKEHFVNDQMMMNALSQMINNRLSENSLNPKCSYMQSVVYFGDFSIAKTKAAFNVVVVAKTNVEAAVKEAMAIVAQACKTGFMEGELSRAKDEIMSSYEKAYNERNKTNSNTVAQTIIRHFIDNEPAQSQEASFKLVKEVMPSLTVPALNELAKGLLTDKNQVIVVSTPLTPYERVLTSALKESIDMEYQPYVDKSVDEPLLISQPVKGSVTASKANAEFGTTELTLSNGVKVIVKPTDFAKDQIMVYAYKNGGLRSYDKSQAANLAFIDNAFEASKIGNYDVVKMNKFLSGKKLSTSYGIGDATNYLSCNSTVKDLPTLMELIYGTFTQLSADPTTYEGVKAQLATILANQDKDPQSVFFRNLNKFKYGDNPLKNSPSVAELEKGSYSEMVKLIRESFANAADYTFVITGNVDMKTLQPLLETYVASLPSTGKAEKAVRISDVNPVNGQVDKEFKMQMKTPITFVYDFLSGENLEMNIDNEVRMQLVGDILDIIFTATLREEMGGTYGASTAANINWNDGKWSIVYLFQTNAGQKADMIKRAYDETLKLLANGAKEEDFNKVKEAALKQYEINVKKNSYWQNNLVTLSRGWNMISGHRQAIESLTLADFNKFMKDLYNGQNRVQVVMEGVAE